MNPPAGRPGPLAELRLRLTLPMADAALVRTALRYYADTIVADDDPLEPDLVYPVERADWLVKYIDRRLAAQGFALTEADLREGGL